MTGFRLVRSETWHLVSIAESRASRLLSFSYPKIIQSLIDDAVLTDAEIEPIPSLPGLRRAALMLKAGYKLVDLFHNGAGGYRAPGIKVGERANRFAISKIVEA